jgi:transposase
MGEPLGTLILLARGLGMPKAYSCDLRERVIEAVQTGASRREAAERFEVSAASAVKWLQRWSQERSAAPKPRGGSVSPLEEFAAEILKLVAEQPDLTLVETVAKLDKRRIKTSRSSLSRFFNRHDITFKKKPASGRTTARRCGAGAPSLDARARHVRSRPVGIYRRDRRQHQFGAAVGTSAVWPAGNRQRAVGKLADDHIRGRSAAK